MFHKFASGKTRTKTTSLMSLPKHLDTCKCLLPIRSLGRARARGGGGQCKEQVYQATGDEKLAKKQKTVSLQLFEPDL